MTPQPTPALPPDHLEPALWEDTVGFPPHVITAYENAEKKRVLYLKRWDKDAGNWRKRSLRRTLTDAQGERLRGRALKAVQAWALEEARKWYAEVTGTAPTLGTLATLPAAAPLTIGQAAARITDAGTGRYPTDSHYRRELLAALTFATRIWGSDRAWNTIRKADIRLLGRKRIDELKAAGTETAPIGYRGAEVTLARIQTVATWLRGEELIEENACVFPRDWKEELRRYWADVRQLEHGPEATRPRHTREEILRIIAKAWDVDPRLALLLELGAELRAGQVERCRRSDLALTLGAHGRLRVRGKGKKGGAVVHLTKGQRAAVERALGGYLATLEAAHQAGTLADYPLFPQGQMPGGRKGTPVADVARHGAARPLNKRTLLGWFHEAERLAEVEPVKGRAFYGGRRGLTDAAKEAGISREALKEHGGWADTQVPDTIYAEAESEHFREEARAVRARIRGEPEA